MWLGVVQWVYFLQRATYANFDWPLEKARRNFGNAVAKVDTAIEQEDRHACVYDIQQENVDLQLEAR